MFFKQLYLLLWKNFIIRIRHVVRTIIEIIWPVLLFSILIAVRLSIPPDRLAECHYPARAMPSAGVFPWFQTMFCNMDNPCFNQPVASETPGQVNDPVSQSSGATGGFQGLIGDIQEQTTIFDDKDKLRQDIIVVRALANEITRSGSSVRATVSSLMGDSAAVRQSLIDIGLSENLADTLLQSEVTFYQVNQLANDPNKNSMVCNPTELNDAISLPGSPLNLTQTSSELCDLSDAQKDQVWNTFVEGLDFQQFYTANGDDLLNTAGLNSGLNLADMAVIALRLPELAGDMQIVIRLVVEFLSELDTSSNSTQSFLTSALGISSTNLAAGFQQFCGHPAPKQGVAQNLTAGMLSVIATLNDNSTDSTFCKNFINEFETNDNLSFAWTIFKPVLFGKILYSPDTPLTRDIMSRANQTFGAIAELESVARTWLNTNGLGIYDYLESGATVALIRTVLASNLSSLGIPGFTISPEEQEILQILLSNNETSNQPGTVTWKQLYRQINIGIVLVRRVLDCMNVNKFEGHADESVLVERSLNLLENNTFWAAIVFESPTANDTVMPKHIRYKLRQDVDDVMRTDFIKMYFWTPGPRTGQDYLRYFINGFADMQDMIEQGITRTIAAEFGDAGFLTTNFYSNTPQIGYYLQQMPYPCYTSDTFLEYLSSMMSLLMTLAWIYSVCIIIKNIVYEKEERLKEFMRMMGLSNGVHWVAWFINSFYLMFLSSLLLIGVLRAGTVLPYSNPFILLIWLLSFCFATIGQCFLISCFFTKANLAAACGGIIYFLLYVPYNFAVTWEDELSYGGKIGLSLFSTVAFGYGAAFVTKYEMSGDGIQFHNWNTSPVPDEQYTFVTSLIMMLVDGVIYFILTWYVENVYPGKYGIPRPPYFMFTASYWCGTPEKSDIDSNSFLNPACSSSNVSIEAEPEHLNLGVSIKNLTKIYTNGNKVAVDNLSLNFYEGQITSFLGHNGAGKTTTMSILCGLYTPTQGTAYIHGHDIKSEMDAIRHSLGMCPQHNVLFRDLTVEEHLNFYAGLRGIKKDAIRVGTDRMLEDVNLLHKRDEVVGNLSGGMKRKLSVAVAFTGDSKTVILDEPTAGVDPYARRGIWDLLLKYREGRTIILSTHHMDEADLLGDRIAIISQGKLKCCGSSLFLKSTYGVGYYLTLVKQKIGAKENVENTEPAVLDVTSDLKLDSDDEGFSSRGTSSKSSMSGAKPSVTINNRESMLTAKEALNIIHNVVPNARTHEENVGEITFILPYEAIKEGKYVELFQSLDDNNIAYGLMDTSLEEIFLSVADHPKESSKPEKSCCSCLPRKRHHSTSSIAPYTESRENNKNAPVQLTKVSKIEEDSSIPSSDNLHEESPGTSEASPVTIPMETVEEEDEDQFEDNGNTNGKGSYQLRGRKLISQQFLALMIKRFLHARRNRKGIFAQIILPSTFVLVALCLTLILPPYDGQPRLELQPWMYGENLATFYSNDDPSNNDSSAISDALVNFPGFGTRCIDGYQIENYVEVTSTDPAFLNCIPSPNDQWQVEDEIQTLSQPASAPNYTTCSCTGDNDRILLAECPLGAGGSETPFLITNTTDKMFNMTERDVADWLVKTTDKYIEKRYGGLSVGEKYHSSIDNVTLNLIIDVLVALNATTADNPNISIFLENMWRTDNGKIWYDNNGFHAMPAYMNIMSNGVMRSKLPSSANPAEYGITVYSHPLNYTRNQISQATAAQTAIDASIAIVVVFAMSFVPASFVIFLIDERVTKAKHLQFISGVNQAIYWIANYIWDMLNYMVPTIIVTIIFLCFQTEAYVSPRNLPCLILLLVLYGWSITPMMYPFSFVFEVSSTAYVVLTCVNLFIGINTTIATLILDLLEGTTDTAQVNAILQKVFLIFPHFCMGRGLIDMAINEATADAWARFGVDTFVNPLSWDLAGKNLAAMAIEGFVFFGITLLIQYRFFIKPSTNVVPETSAESSMIDDDVIAEKFRIRQQKVSNDILRIEDLSKVYKKMPLGRSLLAVDRMSVGVSGGECFGLLGVNGAGKTTTFKMLTGDITPTAGNATVRGISINDDIRSVQQNSGYCPQFDALNSHLTGFEHLQLYARLRGVPHDEIDDVAMWGITKLGLKHYADKPAGTYSGGNKRKLSAAIAFIGCPPIIFLDEPTAGMDPGARRFLWKRILEVVKVDDQNTNGHERCIVLTSHSMEECEALCSRLAIMVNGRFMCIGTPQHLKNKYGKGYSLTVRVAGMDSNLDNVQDFLLKAFDGSILKERHHNMITLQLPAETARLAEVFKLVETNKSTLEIEDYSVSQTTLDEVFVNFAKHQTDGYEDELVDETTNTNLAYNQYEMTQVTDKHHVVA